MEAGWWELDARVWKARVTKVDVTLSPIFVPRTLSPCARALAVAYMHLSGRTVIRRNNGHALWFKTAKNTDCSTGPLARPFARGKVIY